MGKAEGGRKRERVKTDIERERGREKRGTEGRNETERVKESMEEKKKEPEFPLSCESVFCTTAMLSFE